MHRLSITACACLLAVSSAASLADDRPSTRTGTYRDFLSFPSTVLKNARAVTVFLPPSYEREQTRRYPVLYAMDGQNLFDERGSFIGKEWRVDETLAKLWEEKRAPEMIVVGIANTPDRMKEYMPGSDGDRYIKFLTSELKPFIDNRFRTMKAPRSTGVMGSSMGALIAIWAGVTRPDVFGLVAALSPSLQFADPVRQRLMEGARPPIHLYMDMGGEEVPGNAKVNQELVTAFQEARSGLQQLGYQEGKDFIAKVYPGAHHNEPAWAARLDQPLEFLFSPNTYKP